MTRSLSRNSKFGQWLSYSGLATAFLALNHTAAAQAFEVDLDQDLVLENADLPIDFDGDGITDITVTHYTYTSSGLFYGSAILNLPANTKVIGQVDGNRVDASVLELGSPIAPGDPDLAHMTIGRLVTVFSVSGENAGLHGNWQGPSGFLGLQFRGR